MNSSIYKFLLDLHYTQSQISLPVTKGDTARVFLIRLADGGLPYVINDGVLAKIEIKRPTGTRLENFCAIEKNTTIRYNFSQNENTAAVEGVHDCAVILYNAEGEKVASARFTMVVSDRVVNSDDIVLTDEDFTAVDAMLAKEAERQTVENARKAAEDIRASNDEKRAAAESARVEAENKRAIIEQERQTNESRRMTAEQTRVIAEQARIGNEERRNILAESLALAEAQRVTAESDRVFAEKNRENENSRRQGELESAIARVEGLEDRIGEALDIYIDEVNELIGGDE